MLITGSVDSQPLLSEMAHSIQSPLRQFVGIDDPFGGNPLEHIEGVENFADLVRNAHEHDLDSRLPSTIERRAIRYAALSSICVRFDRSKITRSRSRMSFPMMRTSFLGDLTAKVPWNPSRPTHTLKGSPC